MDEKSKKICRIGFGIIAFAPYTYLTFNLFNDLPVTETRFFLFGIVYATFGVMMVIYGICNAFIEKSKK